MTQLTQMDSWKSLERQATLFSFRHQTIQHPILSDCNLHLDFNAQFISETTRQTLFHLAEECQLKQKIIELFTGCEVNVSEKKPALHWATRANLHSKLLINGHDIIPDIERTRNALRDISNKIRAQEWRGYSGKAITDVINLGIGGSHLGPFFCLHALADLTSASLGYHFISDFDPHSFSRVTASLNPETTLFIVSSKSFTTAETIYNLKQAMAWINKPEALDKHFIAATAAPQKALYFGLNNILPMWEWIGGRYSTFSAVNLITCIAIGYEAFSELLEGAAEMDEHYRLTNIEDNLPINLALLGLWTNNFLKINQLLLLTYAQPLDYFTAYIQQLDMESNGKSIDRHGKSVNYATSPIIWGGSGNQAQHSYYQLLCQGTHKIAVDLISVDSYQDAAINQLCEAQKAVLSHASAKNKTIFIRERAAINHLRLKDVSPRTIGALIALYEHKIYTQSVIWQINPFDQPGVESSKQLMKEMSYA